MVHSAGKVRAMETYEERSPDESGQRRTRTVEGGVTTAGPATCAEGTLEAIANEPRAEGANPSAESGLQPIGRFLADWLRRVHERL